VHEFVAQLINGISLGAIYALVALGYTLVYGILELINFAHGDVSTFGAFVALAVLEALGVHGALHGITLVVVSFLACGGAALSCAVVNAGIERLAYRPLRNAPRLAPLITAIGVSFILENVMQLWRGPAPVPVPGFFPNLVLTAGGMTVTLQQIVLVGMTIAATIVLQLVVKRTRLGMAMRAVAQDREAAALVGIDVNAVIAATFVIAGLLAGIAGFASSMYYQSTWFLNGFDAGLKAFTAAVLGGIGNLGGAVLGGFLIGIIEALATWQIGGQWSNVAVFAILVGVLVVRPSGLLGESVPEKV
jgi:branched-chain amino acid transport system permease protein